MTGILAAIVVLQSPSLFNQSAAAHAKYQDVSAHILVAGNTNGTRERMTIDLVAQGSTILIRTQEPPKGGFDRTDRRYLLKGDSLRAYDAVANEWLGRTAPPGGSRVNRLTAAMGAVEEVVANLIDSGRMKTLDNNLSHLKGWKLSLGPGVKKLVRSDSGRNTSRVVFDGKSNLLRELNLTSPKGTLNWRIDYLPMPPIALDIPPNAKHVASFTIAEAPPTFGDAGAKAVYTQMLSAAANLRSATLTISDGSGKTRIAFSRTQVKESQPGFTWAFAGHSLIVKRGSKFSQGPVRQAEIIDIVSKLGGRVEPFTRNLLLKRVPFKEFFGSGDKIKTAGSLSAGGTYCVLLRADGPRRRTTLLIRRDVNLPQSVTTELLDATGATLSTNTREYSYQRINKPQPAGEFAFPIPRGVRPGPLPKPSLPTS